MSLPALALALLLLAPPPGPRPVRRVQPPVVVSAVVQAATAEVALTFAAEASAVEVRLAGADGLVLQGEPAAIHAGHYSPGQTAALKAAFTPGPGASRLLVFVTCTVRGAARTTASSFPVPAPPKASPK